MKEQWGGTGALQPMGTSWLGGGCRFWCGLELLSVARAWPLPCMDAPPALVIPGGLPQPRRGDVSMGTRTRHCVQLGPIHPTPCSLWCTGSAQQICDQHAFGNLSVTSTPQIMSRKAPEPSQKPVGRRHMVCCTSVCVGHSSEWLGWRGTNAANLAGHPACPSSLFRPANAVQARAQLLPGRCCGRVGDLWVLRGHPGFSRQ